MPLFSRIRRANWLHCPLAASKQSSLDRTSRRMTPSSSLGSKPLDVFAQNIRLQVHRISELAPFQSCNLQCVRDNPDAETLFANLGDSQADSIDGDGAFRDDIAHNSRRRSNLQHPVGPGCFPTD